MTSGSAARKSTDSAPVVLERFLLHRLNVLASLTSNALAQIYADRFGLTIPAWRVVATLGSTASGLRGHCGPWRDAQIDRFRAVSALEVRGLIARKPNRDDRREELLELTDDGSAVYEALARRPWPSRTSLLRSCRRASTRS